MAISIEGRTVLFQRHRLHQVPGLEARILASHPNVWCDTHLVALETPGSPLESMALATVVGTAPPEAVEYCVVEPQGPTAPCPWICVDRGIAWQRGSSPGDVFTAPHRGGPARPDPRLASALAQGQRRDESLRAFPVATTPLADTSADLVPLMLPALHGRPPIHPSAALVGGPVTEIGAPFFAMTNLDLDGCLVDVRDPKILADVHRGQWIIAAVVGAFLGAVVGVVVGVALSSTMGVLIGLLAAVVAVILRRPKPTPRPRVGMSLIVGSEGAVVGDVNGATRSRGLIRYDDDTAVWFLQRPTAQDPYNTFTVRDRATLARRAQLAHLPLAAKPSDRRSLAGAERLRDESAEAFAILASIGVPHRIDLACMALLRGERVVLPILDGRALHLSLRGLNVAALSIALVRDGNVELDVRQVEVLEGDVIRLVGADRTETIHGSQIGDAGTLIRLTRPTANLLAERLAPERAAGVDLAAILQRATVRRHSERDLSLTHPGSLIMRFGPYPGQPTALSGETLLGTHAYCDVPIDDPDVAPLHALLTPGANGTYVLRDLGSATGTQLGPSDTSIQEVVLRPRDRLRIGTYIYEFSPSYVRYGGHVRDAWRTKAFAELARMYSEVVGRGNRLAVVCARANIRRASHAEATRRLEAAELGLGACSPTGVPMRLTNDTYVVGVEVATADTKAEEARLRALVELACAPDGEEDAAAERQVFIGTATWSPAVRRVWLLVFLAEQQIDAQDPQPS